MKTHRLIVLSFAVTCVLLSSCTDNSVADDIAQLSPEITGTTTPDNTDEIDISEIPSETRDATIASIPTDESSPTIEPTPTVEPSPSVEPTPTQFIFPASIEATSVCQDSPRTRLILNERARVTDEDQRFLNVRVGPGIDYDAIGRLDVGQIFMVESGPQCGGDYTWYFINYKGVEGWIAEGDTEIYYVEPYLPG